MRKRIFVDTNIIISGIFFAGNEAKLLSLEDIDLYTSDVVIQELKDVAIRKFKSLKMEDKRLALMEIERSLVDFELIIEEKDYRKNIGKANELIRKEKDSRILAAVLTIGPDCFVTGDKDFHNPRVKQIVAVRYTKQVLAELGITPVV